MKDDSLSLLAKTAALDKKSPPVKKTKQVKAPPPSKKKRVDRRLETAGELPPLPALSKPISYLESKDLPSKKVFYFREVVPDTDWLQAACLKRVYKPFSHLGQYTPPTCLLLECQPNEQDCLVVLNWWRSLTHEEQRKEMVELRNTYANPTKSNRLLPADYWVNMEKSKQLQEQKSADKNPTTDTSAAAENKLNPPPIPCRGWRGGKYLGMFRYAMETYCKRPEPLTRLGGISTSIPILFSQAKNISDLHFCVEESLPQETMVIPPDPQQSPATSTAAADPTQPALPPTANLKDPPPAGSHTATEKDSKYEFVLKSRNCEGIIHRVNYQKQLRCRQCMKFSTAVQNLRDLSTNRMKNANKSGEKLQSHKTQLSSALKREARLRTRLKKYRDELRARKKAEQRRAAKSKSLHHNMNEVSHIDDLVVQEAEHSDDGHDAADYHLVNQVPAAARLPTTYQSPIPQQHVVQPQPFLPQQQQQQGYWQVPALPLQHPMQQQQQQQQPLPPPQNPHYGGYQH